jgi:hypothetical protein
MSHPLRENETFVQSEGKYRCRDEHQETRKIHIYVVDREDSQSSHIQEIDKNVYRYEPEYQNVIMTIEHQFADGFEIEKNPQNRGKQNRKRIMDPKIDEESEQRISKCGIQHSHKDILGKHSGHEKCRLTAIPNITLHANSNM